MRTGPSAAGRVQAAPAASSTVELLDARSTTGRRYALALSPWDGGVAYVLTQTDAGVWRCACPNWRGLGTCEHTTAARMHRQQTAAAGR